jgi:hypothetical protein
MRRLCVRVIVDDRGAGVPTCKSRYGPRQQYRGDTEREDEQWADQAARDSLSPISCSQRAASGKPHDPDRYSPLGARSTEEGECIECIGNRRQRDVHRGAVQIDVAGHRTGDRVDQRRQRMNCRNEEEQHERDRDRVAAQQVHSQIPRISGRVEISSRWPRTR